MSQAQSNSGQAGRFKERKPQDAGIVVFASNRRVLYVNQAGRELFLRLNDMEKGSVWNGRLPTALAALLDEIAASPEAPHDDRGWRRFPGKRLDEAAGGSLFVQAFAQRHDPRTPRPVIVLTMQSADDEG